MNLNVHLNVNTPGVRIGLLVIYSNYNFKPFNMPDM